MVYRGLAPSGYVATYVGHETRNDAAVEHLTISQSFSTLSVSQVAHLQPLSQIDLYLDSSSFLPVAATLNVHPDNNELMNIPIAITFSDYRTVGTAQVPFHVQRFLNNGLVLDLQFQNVLVNSGLTGSQFAVQ
jgi:hypothetical protein